MTACRFQTLERRFPKLGKKFRTLKTALRILIFSDLFLHAPVFLLTSLLRMQTTLPSLSVAASCDAKCTSPNTHTTTARTAYLNSTISLHNTHQLITYMRCNSPLHAIQAPEHTAGCAPRDQP
ncbi:unnamed protein product [Pylaiella littoralis]